MRERWFFVQGVLRRGPFSLTEVVAAVQGEPDPRTVLVWHKGLREWTRAEVVPEIRQQLARAGTPDDTLPLAAGPGDAGPRRDASAPARRLRLGFAAVAALAGVAATVAAVVQIRSSGHAVIPPGPVPTSPPTTSVSASPSATPPASPPASTGATPPAVSAARLRVSPQPALALAADEADLPGAELRKLRGVASWSGDTLKLTVYNATTWRVTELQVRIERLTGEDFVADDRPISLVPPSQRVDDGVADLLARVAPERKKPGLNPLDTGAFEATAGAAPEGFRWEIVSAHGYPPAR